VGSGDDYGTAAYDTSTGARVWGQTYNGPGNGYDEGHSVAVSANGSKVFATGGSVGSIDYDYATLAYSASTGTQLWVSRYAGAGDGVDIARSLALSPDGSKVFATGSTQG